MNAPTLELVHRQTPTTRAISVAATHDVILTSLNHIQEPQKVLDLPTFLDNDEDADLPVDKMFCFDDGRLLTDETMFNRLLPTFETVFAGRKLHRLSNLLFFDFNTSYI